MVLVRDAMAGHALRLDLVAMDEAGRVMCATTFGVIASDIEEIESELKAIAESQHIAGGPASVDPSWPVCTENQILQYR
jgi:ABC-type phosphate/phosphonate transport system substrate-binding protein